MAEEKKKLDLERREMPKQPPEANGAGRPAETSPPDPPALPARHARPGRFADHIRTNNLLANRLRYSVRCGGCPAPRGHKGCYHAQGPPPMP